MKIQFWSVGKAHESYVSEGITKFTSRIGHYYPVDWKLIPPVKNSASLAPDQLKQKEAEVILSMLQKEDVLILLDERGKMWTSIQLAEVMQDLANAGTKQLIFLIGGAYGVDEPIFKRAKKVWSLSPLVFPHQLVRLILAEQVYRACTIQRGEGYHHT
jgi:23S rRNA (pseudouridine1915-N3)-methyltransferase